MRNKSSIPGWRALASRYCCIIGVIAVEVDGGRWTVDGVKNKTHGSMPWVCLSSHRPLSTVHRPLLFGSIAVRRIVRPHLAHRQLVARRDVGDLGHVVAHQQEAAAAGALEVLRGHRVGHVLGVEAL